MWNHMCSMWNRQLKPGAFASPLIWLRMFWFTQNSELFITQAAVKSHSTCTLGPLQTRFCFYFGARVSKYQMKPVRVCSFCVFTLPCNDLFNPIWIETVFFGMLPILGDHPPHLVLPPWKSCSPIHTPPTRPPHDLLSHVYTVVLCVRHGQGERWAWFSVLSPSVRDLKTHFNPRSVHFFWVCLLLFPFTASFSTPLPPMPCSFLLSDTPPPPLPFPSALCAACQGKHPLLSALLSPALLPESVPFPLASSVHIFPGLSVF